MVTCMPRWVNRMVSKKYYRVDMVHMLVYLEYLSAEVEFTNWQFWGRLFNNYWFKSFSPPFLNTNDAISSWSCIRTMCRIKTEVSYHVVTDWEWLAKSQTRESGLNNGKYRKHSGDRMNTQRYRNTFILYIRTYLGDWLRVFFRLVLGADL